MKFSEKLIKLRKENKLSQEQLASKLDVSRQAVSKWESGQAYPEMDKLLALCKIFKCSLDDLTNDEISKEEMSTNQNKKNSFINFYEMLEFINKSISMLKSMSFKEIMKMLLMFVLLGIFLLILRIPFALIIDTGWNLLYHLDMSYNFKYATYNIWSFLINIIYLILITIILIYIYKVRYLDKFEESEEAIIKYVKEKKEKINKENNKKEVKVEERVVIKKERSFALFNVLGTIMQYIIKFIAVCIFLPFVCTLVILAFFLIIDIILTFKGVIFIGVLLGIIFALLFNYMVIEVTFKFIFNMHINFKKIFVIFITSIFGIGISVGIFTLEATSLKVYDEIPKEIVSTTIIKEMKLDNDSYIFFNSSYYVYEINNQYQVELASWDYGVEKNYDERMNDTVKIEFIYNEDYTNLELFEENKKMEIFKYSNANYNTLIKLINIIIDNLKNKEIYNYDTFNYQKVKVVITTSTSNHELLENNAKEIAIEKEQSYIQNRYNQYEQEIADLNEHIYELEEDYDILESEKNEKIGNLEEQLTNKEQELQEYKDRISELLDE